jgi:serpin B
LHVANALWGQQGLPFRQEYLTDSQKHFGATLHPVDFRQTEQARQTINRWVEEQTKDRIKDLLPRGSLDALTGLVLTNAIYFKGQWVQPFHKELTKDEPFTTADGRKAPVPLMRRGDRFRYFAGDGLQAVELPYVGDRVSMVVLLPAKADGLADLEKSLTPEKLAGWVGQLRPQPGDVLLPRFTATAEFELADTLEKLGMRLAFTRQADFSGILSGEPLFISKVVHKAFVDVNEEGSEAAAATGVVMTRASAPLNPPKPFTFRADHPFLYLIRDTATGGVLFLGRYAGPGA